MPKSAQKLVWIIVSVLGFLALGRIAIWAKPQIFAINTERRISVEDVKKELRREIPPGTKRSEVAAYLDAKAIPHSHDGASEADEYQETEVALIRNSSNSFLIRGDIQIRFRFDESDKLTDYSVQEIFTGP
jgi:hypothetical protein